MAPRLSIVTITHRDAPGLARTIASLRRLDASVPWEHIVVDSSPTDNRSTLDGLAEAGWPLRHVTSPAEGVYAAQNAGAAQARGELVWFLNGGDELLDAGALGECVRAFDSPTPPDLVVGAVELRRDGQPMSVQRPHRRLVFDLVGRNRVCHQGVLYRRDVFARIGPFSTEFRFAADYEHLLRCLAGNSRVEVRPGSVIAAYDVTGVSSQRYNEVFAEFRAIHHKLFGRVPLVFSAASEVARPLEHARVAAAKALGALPFGPRLRSLWHRLKSQ